MGRTNMSKSFQRPHTSPIIFFRTNEALLSEFSKGKLLISGIFALKIFRIPGYRNIFTKLF